jgi:hypothetical protein
LPFRLGQAEAEENPQYPRNLKVRSRVVFEIIPGFPTVWVTQAASPRRMKGLEDMNAQHTSHLPAPRLGIDLE